MSSVSFTVEGEPVAKERPRTVTNAYGESRTITPSKTKDHEAAIAWAFKAKYPGHELMTGPVEMDVVFYTDSRSKDLDNMLKCCLDALNGVVFADDRQVERIIAAVYRKKGLTPVTSIMLWEAVDHGEEEADAPADHRVLGGAHPEPEPRDQSDRG